jgi:hypothetical protein
MTEGNASGGGLPRRAVLGGAAALALAPGAGAAAPSAERIAGPWSRRGTGGGPEPAVWARMLERHRSVGPDGVARFDYAAARDERPALRDWLAEMQAADPTAMTSETAFAFWCDLYNGLTVDLVLEAWPVDSIREVRGGLFNTGPWNEKVATVLGRELSLDDIEHGILRPVWGDARVHYAVNCASIGCPDLGARPWLAEPDLDAALDREARGYVNHPRGAAVRDGRLVVSSIYDWFQADFGGDDAGVIRHLRSHAEAPLRKALAGVSRISEDRYDWSINAPA